MSLMALLLLVSVCAVERSTLIQSTLVNSAQASENLPSSNFQQDGDDGKTAHEDAGSGGRDKANRPVPPRHFPGDRPLHPPRVGREGRDPHGNRGFNVVDKDAAVTTRLVDNMLGYDQDGDRALNQSELPESLSRVFSVIDRDRDLVLSRKELVWAFQLRARPPESLSPSGLTPSGLSPEPRGPNRFGPPPRGDFFPGPPPPRNRQ